MPNPGVQNYFRKKRELHERGEALDIIGRSALTARLAAPFSGARPPERTQHQTQLMEAWLEKNCNASITQSKIDEAMEFMHRQRALSINNPIANKQVVAKDLSVRVKRAHMGFTDSNDADYYQANAAHIQCMLEVARSNGFKVHVTTTEAGEALLMRCLDLRQHGLERCLRINIVPKGAEEVWAEDSGRFNLDGRISIPATLSAGWEHDSHIFDLLSARARRYHVDRRDEVRATISAIDASDRSYRDKIQELRRVYPETNFSTLGSVATKEFPDAPMARGIEAGKTLCKDYTYQEGGNTLVGVRRDGTPFALVGRDSVEYSRSLLGYELDEEFSDRKLRLYLGADLGIDPRQVFFIEQPGAFPLDMAMALMGPGEVLINDPVEAARVAEPWIRKAGME
ncbi:MAG: hypothetical protein ACRYF5_07155, partial [Janthinobacterium lividum]